MAKDPLHIGARTKALSAQVLLNRLSDQMIDGLSAVRGQ